jgi:hypothetical protein
MPRQHHIACYLDGEHTDTVTASALAATMGVTEAAVLASAHDGTELMQGLRLVDEHVPRGTCIGCFMECSKPYPCSRSLRMWATMMRNLSGGRRA